MKTFNLNLKLIIKPLFIFVCFSNLTVIAATRAMTETDRSEIRNTLNTVLQNNSSECYVNVSNLNNIDIVNQANENHTSYIERTSKNTYTKNNLSSILNLISPGVALPEGVITEITTNSFSVTYSHSLTLNLVEIKYDEIQTTDSILGYVTHVFETQDGKAVWKNSFVDLFDDNGRRPHIRCKADNDSDFPKGESIIKGHTDDSFVFLDLELSKPEYCMKDCPEITVQPSPIFFY